MIVTLSEMGHIFSAAMGVAVLVKSVTGVGLIMTVLVSFSQRYVTPFLTGVCFAGATVVHDVPTVAALVLVGGAFGFLSFPAAGRMIRRMSGAAS
jgi:hypothetical protein